MAGNGLQMDWSGVSFTPNSGASIVFDEVKDCAPADGGQFERFMGNADKYARKGRTVNNTATVRITAGNSPVLQSVPRNVIGTLTFTHNDYLNGSGSGAVVYTLINAQRIHVDDGGGNNQFGIGTITFEGLSPDGQTSPFSYVVTP